MSFIRLRRAYLALPVLLALGCATATEAPAATSEKFDFGPRGLSPASGYTADDGVGYSTTRGFGWIREDSVTSSTKVPLSIVGNGRERSQVSDQRLGSIMHMQLAQAGGGSTGVTTPAAWQAAVPNGTYTVTVAVGDTGYTNSRNQINVEGKPLISGFTQSASTPYRTATGTFTVSDGALTIDARGGTNTKLAYVTLASTTAAVPAAIPATTASAPASFYGTNAQYVFGDDTLAARYLTGMANNNVSTVRADLPWSDVQRTAGGSYSWGYFDRMATQMAKARRQWVPVLMRAPAWAAAHPTALNSGPARSHFNDFVAFARATAQRYGRGGSFWRANPSLPAMPVTTYEIWNEENAAYWWGTTTNAPEDYADLFIPTRDAIKAVDGGADVLIGGVAPTSNGAVWSSDFVTRMVAHRPSLYGSVDGVAFHPYAKDVAYVYNLIHDFRATVDQRLGTGTDIHITETGWSTAEVSVATQGANLAKLATELPRSDCRIKSLQIQTWVQKASGSARDNGMALWVIGSTSPTAGGTAYFNAIRLMLGKTSTAPPTGTVRICH